MKWANKGHEFDYLKSIFNRDKIDCYIWGAGTFGQAFYDEFSDKLNVVGFIDSNYLKQNYVFCEMQVISPQAFFERRKEEIVFVATGWTNQVYKVLKENGLERFIDYFHIDEWYSLYHYYVNNKVYVSDITMQITERCTLKCKNCNAFIPMIDCPKNFSLEYILENTKAIFSIVDKVNIFGFSGGDAMANPLFPQILETIAELYYPDRISHIEIYSNAVIDFTQDVLDLLKKYNVIYRWTDYGNESGRQNSDYIEQRLKENNIKYDRAHFESWYDCGYPQESNGIADENALISFCTSCDRKSCHGIWDKKLLSCALCYAADRINYCSLEPSDYLDLSDFNSNRLVFIEYYLGFSEKGYYNYCKKCNGGPNINTKKMISGEQVISQKEN